ncbi:MAG TPA: RsmD family RNA methyltransferase [Candidatus Saccharimonadales bacterium]|nr:RsmD family RNA methyltransferase [Candidatus Saccharimonadales bacterium]
MRIIAGALKGRQFQAPKGHRTHPMSEKMRGAIFNSLGDIKDLTVLDAFGGSGALSLEAISRGAKSALAIEIDKNAHKTLLTNISGLNPEEQIKAIQVNASAWSSSNENTTFDVVLLDPPHDDLRSDLLVRISQHTAIKGIMVLSWPGKAKAPIFPDFEEITIKKYGDAQLVFYRRIS